MNKQILTPVAAAQYIHDNLQGLDHEECWAIYLSPSNTILSSEMLSKGTLTSTAIDVRTVLRQALLHNAKSIILLHNHVSGDPLPSAHDIKFTSRLKNACSLMDLTLLDHIIVAEQSFYSFSEERTISN